MNEAKADIPEKQNFYQWLYTPVDCSTLVLFRIIFSGLVLLYAILDWQDMSSMFPAGEFRPTYTLLRFTEDWPRLNLNWMFSLLCLSATGVITGVFYRVSAILQFLAFTYIYHADPTQYNNHYYVISLLAFWLIFVRADAQLSVDQLWFGRGNRSTTIPRWHTFLMQLHISMTYFFGGIVKFNSDWLQGQPMTPWLAVEGHRPIIGSWLAHPQAGVIVAWMGLVFDLTIPFLLIYKPTRILGFIGTLMFHLNNSWIFRIGIFPYLMIGANVLYLEPETPRRWWNWLTGKSARASQTALPLQPPAEVTTQQRFLSAILIVYALLHCLMPFRHYWYAGNVEWNEEAKNFSWRMMLSYKDTGFFGVRVVADGIDDRRFAPQQFEARGFLKPRRVGNRIDVRFNHLKYLTERQERGKGVMGNPRHMAAFARFVKKEAIQLGLIHPRVYVVAISSLNGRPFQFLVDPFVDLASVEVPLFKTPDWIVPLKPDQPIGHYPMDDEQLNEMVMPLFKQYQHEFYERVLRGSVGPG